MNELGTLAASMSDANDILPKELRPWKPGPNDPWDRRKAGHLMRRAGFGAKPEELDVVVSLGMDRTVDILLTAAPWGVQDSGTLVLPNGEVLSLSWDLASQRAQWLWEMVHTEYPLKEKMALFWHDHFSVGQENLIARTTSPAHINLFRRLGLGSFRDILIEVTRDPAMLLWLDNYLNGRPRRGVPQINENYGRELLELYTMGVNGGYTQTDVVEASKCLSGWSLVGRTTPAYRSSYHVTGPKTVLGTTIDNGTNGEQDLYDLVDVLLAWPATSRNMVEKIWRYFVHAAPDGEWVKLLAGQWRQDRFELRALMSVLLRSREFYSDRAIAKLVKNPVEFTVGAIRNTGITPINRYRTLASRVEGLGYPLLDYSNPSGLEDGVAWVDSQALINRANLANELTQVRTTAGFRSVFDPFREINRLNLTTAAEIVDHYLGIMVNGAVPAPVRTLLLDFMNRNDSGPSPFTGTNTQIEIKVRGLVHLILSLPEYQMN